MIRLKETIIQLDSIDKEVAESNIRSRITKKYSLSLTNTSAWSFPLNGPLLEKKTLTEVFQLLD